MIGDNTCERCGAGLQFDTRDTGLMGVVSAFLCPSCKRVLDIWALELPQWDAFLRVEAELNAAVAAGYGTVAAEAVSRMLAAKRLVLAEALAWLAEKVEEAQPPSAE